MRFSIAFVLVALASTASAQKNQCAAGGALVLPGHESERREHYYLYGGRRNSDSRTDLGGGIMLRYERLVGPWSIGLSCQANFGDFNGARHIGALWTKLRAGFGSDDRYGFYVGATGGRLRG